MDDRDLMAAMHNLGEDLTAMAAELADRRGLTDHAAAMIEARAKLSEAYGRVMSATPIDSLDKIG